MPRLVVVIGANGAGKSSWCHVHRRELPANLGEETEQWVLDLWNAIRSGGFPSTDA